MPASKIFTIATTYSETDLRKLRYGQTADVGVIACYGHPLRRLRRFGHNDWRLDDAPIGAQIDAPVGVTVTVNNPQSGAADYLPSTKTYVVTAINEAGHESQASASDSGSNDLSLKTDTNTISWTAHADAVEYRIYEVRSGTYGYLGRSETTSFVDDNILADFSISPPTAFDPFDGDEYPSTVAFHEARLWAARTPKLPSAVYGSRIDDLFNFDKSRPAQATDSVAFGLRGQRVNAIQHLVSLGGALLALTNDALWSIRGGSSGYISPTSIESRNEGYRGANNARPEIIDDILFYATARGNSVRTSGYTFEKEGFRGSNLSVFAPHFFSGYEITHFAWCETPSGILWCRRNDGKLVALTWQAEQEVWGWTLCETDGLVESICSISENGVDSLYMTVQRQIDGQARRYVERLSQPLWIDENWTAQEDAVVMDAALTYRGTPTTTLSRLDHLEGMDVAVLADGLVKTGHSIVNGRLTPDLDAAYSTVSVGLPYVSYIRTLPVVVQGPAGTTKGRRMIVANAIVELMNTYGIEIGYGLDREIDQLYDAEFPTYSLAVVPPPLFTGTLDPKGFSNGDWEEALVTVLQRRPLPMVVLGVSPDIEVGG